MPFPIRRSMPRRLSRCVLLAASMLFAVAVAAPPWRGAAAAEFTPQQRDAIEGIVRDYLANHPEALIEALQNAEEHLKQAARDKAAAALKARRKEVFEDPDTPVGGNPQGDVSLVEFFDYRCPYCKQVEPSLEKLLGQDKELRFVYKEFPVLGPPSVTAARAALAARKQGKYEAFHRAMMAVKGEFDEAAVWKVARSVGLDLDQLKHDMAAPEIDRVLKRNLALAKALAIEGTPGFVIGQTIVPGAIGLDDLRQLIEEARKKQAG
jgi:protein-disulfide isomerase